MHLETYDSKFAKVEKSKAKNEQDDDEEQRITNKNKKKRNENENKIWRSGTFCVLGWRSEKNPSKYLKKMDVRETKRVKNKKI